MFGLASARSGGSRQFRSSWVLFAVCVCRAPPYTGNVAAAGEDRWIGLRALQHAGLQAAGAGVPLEGGSPSALHPLIYLPCPMIVASRPSSHHSKSKRVKLCKPILRWFPVCVRSSKGRANFALQQVSRVCFGDSIIAISQGVGRRLAGMHCRLSPSASRGPLGQGCRGWGALLCVRSARRSPVRLSCLAVITPRHSPHIPGACGWGTVGGSHAAPPPRSAAARGASGVPPSSHPMLTPSLRGPDFTNGGGPQYGLDVPAAAGAPKRPPVRSDVHSALRSRCGVSHTGSVSAVSSCPLDEPSGDLLRGCGLLEHGCRG